MPVDISISKPPIDALHCELLQRFRVSINVLRLDKCHSLLSGNKWYKLKYNLLEFQRRPELPILSFGGAYSNHLHALAAAGKLIGMRTIGVVRGEIPEPLNPVLAFASEQGMTLLPVSRGDYRRKQEPDFLQQLRVRFGDFHLLPEGGSNSLAIKGCEEIASLLRWQKADSKKLVALCCGTGTTMAGLISGLSKIESAAESAPEILGISVLKGDGYLESEVSDQLQSCGYTGSITWRVDDTHHCGGYARSNPALQSFLSEFAGFSDLPLEPVYTGKLFYALFDLIERGVISEGTEVVAIHSGGIHK
ncbi:MAG: pyridoxal-phosphate dependent enzyme [Gammaproteobacteria bacterium]|nr:pyridoxal-phosphate dependent enzyme [Gammaproteobacteria bacterium]